MEDVEALNQGNVPEQKYCYCQSREDLKNETLRQEIQLDLPFSSLNTTKDGIFKQENSCKVIVICFGASKVLSDSGMERVLKSMLERHVEYR